MRHIGRPALHTSTTFDGDVSGKYNATVVADDSHNHIVGNVDGLQTALDAKAPKASPTFTGDAVFDTDTLKVDATNNRVGIGEASSIDAPLHVNAGAENNAIFVESTDANSFITFGDNNTSGVGHVFVGAIGDDLILGSGNGIRSTIDSSGNVGIGVTPENWDSSGYVHLQIGSSASFRTDTDTNSNFVSY